MTAQNSFSRYSYPQTYFSFVKQGLLGREQKRVDVVVFDHQLPHIPTLLEVQPTPKAKKSLIRKAAVFLSITVLLVSLISISIFILPKVYFSIISPQTVAQTTIEEGSPIGGSFEEGVKNRTATESATLPPIDENLPKGTWIIIPRIGVRTEIQENNDSTKALEKGVWRVPGYGQPGQSGLPIILASHRYGYTWWWQNNYWKYNSFHLLPETQPGDMIEIISGQRKYTYEVYAGAEGQEITDYNADLILYTCKFLDSPVRFFRYARLVDWNKNTQASAALQN